MYTKKKKKRSLLNKTLSVVMTSAVCIGAVATVSAFTKTVTVTDGREVVEIETPKPDSKEVSVVEDEIGQSMLSAFSIDAVQESEVEEDSLVMVSTDIGTAFADLDEVSENEIKIAEWRSIVIELRGEKLEKDVPAGTVEDALAYLQIELSKDDQINTDKSTELTDGMKIVIDRVTYKNVTTTEVVDYKTINKDTSTLYQGESLVDTYGVEGERTIVTKEKYVNGKKVSEKQISNKITTEPIDEVILNGYIRQYR